MMTGVEAGLAEGERRGIEYGKSIGINEGKVIGMSEGEKKKQKEIAKKMLDLKIPIEQIKEITELSEVEINQLLN